MAVPFSALDGGLCCYRPLLKPGRFLHATIGLRGAPSFSVYSQQHEADDGMPNMADLLDALPQDLANTVRDSRTGVCIVIPTEVFAFRGLVLPFSKTSDAMKVAPLELEPRLLWGLEGSSIGLVPNRTPKGTQILAAAIKRSFLEAVKKDIREASLDNALLECEGFARLRDLNHVLRSKKGEATQKGHLFFDQSTSGVHVGYSTPDQGSALQFLPAKPYGSKEALLAGVAYVLKCLQGELSISVPLVVRARETEWYEICERAFGGTFQIVRLEEDPYWRHAFHLRGALRAFLDETPSPRPVPFTIGNENGGRLLPQVVSLLKEGAVIGAFILLLFGLLTAATYMKTKATFETLVSQEKAMFTKAFPQVKPVINPLTQARTLATQERDIREAYLGAVGPAPFGVALETLAQIFLTEGAAKLYEASYRQGELRVLAVAEDTTAYERLKAALRPVGPFVGVRFENVRVQQDGVVFTLFLKLSPAL